MKATKVELGELFLIGSSKRVLKSQWQSSGVPFYRGREVSRLSVDGFVDNELFISEALYAEFASKYGVPASDDILITAIGTIGNSYVVTARDRFYFKDASVLWLKKKAEVSSRFVNLWLKSDLFFMQLERGGGATVDTLTIQKLQAVLVELPSAKDQQRIVAILDEAFDSIATAKANAEKNLQNAKAVFSAYLEGVFKREAETWPGTTLGAISSVKGGKRVPKGSQLQHENTGHPYLRVTDFDLDGSIDLSGLRYISPAVKDKIKKYIINSKDLYISIAGTIGRTGVVPEELSGANLTENACRLVFKPDINNRYVYYFTRTPNFVAQAGLNTRTAAQPKLALSRLATIYLPMPSIEIQDSVVSRLDAIATEVKHLEEIYKAKLIALDELKKSLLQQAFSGQLTNAQPIGLSRQSALQTTTPEFATHVICFAYARHERQKREKTFGRVKEQKLLHLVESIAGIDLGRHPIKDAAGPNDFQHMLNAESWAKGSNVFEMVERGDGYDLRKLAAFDKGLSTALEALKPYQQQLERVIDLLVPMNSQEAGVFATVHAAWNNLLLDGVDATDDAIVFEARENWHADKLKIPESRFRSAIALIREKGVVPDGTAKYVGGQTSLL